MNFLPRLCLIAFAVIFLAVSLSACGPEEGSPEWCDQIKNKKQSDVSIHDAQVFAQKCVSRELNNLLHK